MADTFRDQLLRVAPSPTASIGAFERFVGAAHHRDPARARHVFAVAGAIGKVNPGNNGPALARTLCLAALLHDIGLALDPDQTRMHAFVGADLVRDMGLPEEVAALVAHHSGALIEARLRGVTADQEAWAAFDQPAYPRRQQVLDYYDVAHDFGGDASRRNGCWEDAGALGSVL